MELFIGTAGVRPEAPVIMFDAFARRMHYGRS
jgi:hypothetical protein